MVNTHCHVDHAMADKKFRDLGAQIAVHEADAAAIEKGSRVTAYYLIKEDTGKVAPFPHCPIDMRLADGEELRLGNKVFEVIHTPGHTPGSACFLLRSDGKNVLFSGDTVLYDGRLGWQGNPYADNRQYLSSLQKLNDFTLDGGEGAVGYSATRPRSHRNGQSLSGRPEGSDLVALLLRRRP